MKNHLLTVTMIATFCLAAQRSSAASEKEFAKALNVAGRQRMLSQKMGAEFLMVKLGISTVENKNKLDADIAAFAKALNGLITGDTEAGIPAPPNEQIARQLGQVKLLWANYLRALESGGKSSVGDIALFGDPLLRESDKTVQMYEYAAAEAGFKKTGTVINVAGRQRMLSQKMTKEICLIALDADKGDSRSKLKEARQLFDSSHNALLKGSAEMGIPATTSPEIKKQLAEVDALWKRFDTLVSEVLTDGSANVTKVTAIAALSQDLLKATDKAVTLYGEVDKSAKKS